MIVYRAEERRMSTSDLFAELRQTSTAREALIAFGELESGLCDLIPVAGIRHAALACGRWFSGSDAARLDFHAALDSLEGITLPREVRVPVPEGYAYYALYPEAYAQAARQFARELRPAHAAVIGIRTIGTSLSAAVGGALMESGVPVSSWTVRPTGHPFDRQLRVRERIRTAWSTLAGRATFLIVDEGPGLSGSSFLSVIRALRGCGVREEDIVLFPSWVPESEQLNNEQARAEWPRYRKFHASYLPGLPGGPFEDWSGGRWREHCGGVRVPVNARHEALKYVNRREGRLWKFAGLGRYGQEKLRMADVLGEAGYSPRTRALRDGFIGFDFVRGGPMAEKDVSEGFLDFTARYLGFRAAHFPAAQRSLSFDRVLEMAEFNAQRSFTDLRRHRREFEDRPAIRVDGRMMLHEWIVTERGWLKTDSVDHCRDHFFPGRADPLWDLAGAFVEFGLEGDERQYLQRRYQESANDRFSPGLLQFYETAYLAFRLGYARLSGPDFDSLRDDYSARLGVDVTAQQVIA